MFDVRCARPVYKVRVLSVALAVPLIRGTALIALSLLPIRSSMSPILQNAQHVYASGIFNDVGGDQINNSNVTNVNYTGAIQPIFNLALLFTYDVQAMSTSIAILVCNIQCLLLDLLTPAAS